MESQYPSRLRLGSKGPWVPPLGIGTWAWGDPAGWGMVAREDIHGAFRAAVSNGIPLFDTAEVYGFGDSERLLGECLRESKSDVIVASKFAPSRLRFFGFNLRHAVRQSLKRLGLTKIDLYQIHWHTRWVPVERWMSAMADAVDDGLITAIGVSNYTADQMRRAADALARRGCSLASNQVEYHLLCRDPERNGVLGACRELNATLLAYSPLARGILTGKYSDLNRPSGTHRQRYRMEMLTRLEPLIQQMREIGARHGNKTPAQVALNWLICKGVVPIPGAKNARQVVEHSAAIGWSLTAEDIATLERESARLAH